MEDNFLSNDNYYNKGGLNGKPRGSRPSPPKGQLPYNEYEIVIKQLMHERNELRKYIIGICELLDINTGQSVLGVNCIEFYAVLSSTAKYKIEELQKQFEQKEQECEELKQANLKLGAELCGKLQNYMRTIDEIEKVLGDYYPNGISEIPQSQTEFIASLLTTCEAKLQRISSIIQEVKTN